VLVFFPTCSCGAVATGGVSAVQSSVILFHQLPSSEIGGVCVIPELGIGMKEQILFDVKVQRPWRADEVFGSMYRHTVVQCVSIPQ